MKVLSARDSAQQEEQGPRYYGKYRGVVLQNFDPMGIGRLQVQVIGVFTLASSWAMPSFPVAGIQTGMVSVPPIGSGVWVEFEQGDADYPIWTGCYYSTRAEVPAMAQIAPPPISAMTMQTVGQNSIQISDAPGIGGIILKNRTGASIIINDLGIVITDGKGTISILGGIVDINMGALTVLK